MKEIKVLMIDDNKSLVDMIEEYFSDNEKGGQEKLKSGSD